VKKVIGVVALGAALALAGCSGPSATATKEAKYTSMVRANGPIKDPSPALLKVGQDICGALNRGVSMNQLATQMNTPGTTGREELEETAILAASTAVLCPNQKPTVQAWLNSGGSLVTYGAAS
jgi:hypothetical protein